MKKIVFAGLAALLLLSLNTFGQNNNSIATPSSNNMFLGKTGGSALLADVDLYTGSAKASIPICEVSGRELTVPVSLNYVGGRGIKLQDYATFVGLGWQLAAGGSISRVVRGFPDESSNGYIVGGYGNILYNNKVNGTSLTPAQSTALCIGQLTAPTADGEPDIFFISTPFFRAQFCFDGNGNAIFSNNVGLKISFNNYAYFTVIDENGNTYYFSTTETTNTKLYGTNTSFTTTWYLDQIMSYNSKDNIGFSYITAPSPDTTYHYRSAVSMNNAGNIFDNDNTPITNVVTNPRYISSISSPQAKVDFSYVFNQRRDHYTAGKLTNISLSGISPTGAKLLKNFNFNYNYFGESSTNINELRLKLDNITVSGNRPATETPLPLASFTYNYIDNLPARNSQHFDCFGFYKNMLNQDPVNLIYLRFTPNESNTMANILTSIADISGTSTQFSYEVNSYFNTYITPYTLAGNIPIGGLRVKSISKTTNGQTLIQNFSYLDPATGNSSGQIYSPAYLALQYSYTNGTNWTNYSESPSIYYDINGAYVGYSSVKSTDPSGGYTISNFSNFNSYPDILNGLSVGQYGQPLISSAISYGYKRGQLISNAIYTSAGSIVASNHYSYTSLSNSANNRSSFAYHPSVIGYGGGQTNAGSFYWTNIENYRLDKIIHKDYDQNNNNTEIITNYTYCINKYAVQSISTTDSKGNPVTKTMYHADDPDIPLLNASEQAAIYSMVASNCTQAPVHETIFKNGATSQTHTSYSINSSVNKVFPVALSTYKGSQLLNTQSLVYDPSSGNLISSNLTGGKPTSILYGYNSALPIAKIVNANTASVLQQSVAAFGGNITGGSASYNFTSDYSGSISFSIYNTNSSNTVRYYVYGPSNSSGTLCSNCGSYATLSLPNMPAGNYLLAFTISSSTGPAQLVICSGAYARYSSILTAEYFYEGFEQGNGSIGTAHTGNAYYKGSYNVNYTIPNGSARPYIIQWWSWAKGKWQFNEQPYTAPLSISGIIDDIRIFPADAQMTTFSYDPMVGKTGETDPSGRTVTYEYDGLGRQNIVRDNDRNILSKTCYNYAGQTISCQVNNTVFSNSAQSQSFTKNNCQAGYSGTSVLYSVPAAIYTSAMSQADADNQALNDISMSGQVYANTNGTCAITYYNAQKSQVFTRNNCSSGSTGSTVTYTVNAGAYSSTISQADADGKAQADIDNNGQNYANSNGTCTASSASFAVCCSWGSPFSNFSLSGTNNSTVNFNIILYKAGNPSMSGKIGTLSGPTYLPTSSRYVSCNSGGYSFTLVFYPNGDVYIYAPSFTVSSITLTGNYTK